MAIKRIKVVKKKAPILSHKIQKSEYKKTHRTTYTRTSPLTPREHAKAITLYEKFYSEGVTVSNALKMSLQIDFTRMREDLNAVYIRGISNGMMTFSVKASAKYLQNRYGVASNEIADKHEVNIAFDISAIKRATEKGLDSVDILMNTPIAYQCDCGRHTFWYRYTWTVLKSSIGLQQKVFPRIRNKNLEGLLCKHGIRVMLLVQSKGFIRTFERYLTRVKEGRQFRVVDKDKTSFAGISLIS